MDAHSSHVPLRSGEMAKRECPPPRSRLPTAPLVCRYIARPATSRSRPGSHRWFINLKRSKVMNKAVVRKEQDLKLERRAPLVTPTDLKGAATKDIAGAMNAILADVFALYLKTKNFHWHMS